MKTQKSQDNDMKNQKTPEWAFLKCFLNLLELVYNFFKDRWVIFSES